MCRWIDDHGAAAVGRRVEIGGRVIPEHRQMGRMGAVGNRQHALGRTAAIAELECGTGEADVAQIQRVGIGSAEAMDSGPELLAVEHYQSAASSAGKIE